MSISTFTTLISKSALEKSIRFGHGSGKVSAQPHAILCIQFLDRENNDENNTLPLGKTDLFYNNMGLCGNFTTVALYKISLAFRILVYLLSIFVSNYLGVNFAAS